MGMGSRVVQYSAMVQMGLLHTVGTVKSRRDGTNGPVKLIPTVQSLCAFSVVRVVVTLLAVPRLGIECREYG